MKSLYVESSELNWKDVVTLEDSFLTFRKKAHAQGLALVLTLDEPYFFNRGGVIVTRGSSMIITAADKVRVRYKDGTTKSIKDRIA